jgi:60 kDa SS-A/Ro ribonucleoprotein
MRLNTATAASRPLTHEGARAANLNPEQQLRRSVMACMLFEDTFYEDGTMAAERIIEEVTELLKRPGGADMVANIAYEARTKFKLRHAPLWLVSALAHAQTADARAVVAGALAHVIQRADELAEFLAMYWTPKKQPLSAQVKKGLALAFQKFSAYDLAKYNRDAAIKLRDVMFLVHPKPKDAEQAEVWKKLAGKTLESPDTWEVALSAGADKRETFARLLQERKLGALALLRNLRNMIEAGVDEALIRDGIRSMNAERVLPFRFITAARYAPQLEPDLEGAMFKCLASMPKLPGSTVLVLDHSGSMEQPISNKSELRRADAAAALAMLLREICEKGAIMSFSERAAWLPPRRGFALRDAFMGSMGWGGTNTADAIAEAARHGYDRCIVLTDEQSHQSISHPIRGKKGYFVNVAAYRNGIGYGDWMHIDGWSEAIIDFIQQSEAALGEVQ